MGDKTFFLVTVAGNLVISLVLGSVFYQLSPDASSITSRCILLFFAILFNALSSSLEVRISCISSSLTCLYRLANQAP